MHQLYQQLPMLEAVTIRGIKQDRERGIQRERMGRTRTAPRVILTVTQEQELGVLSLTMVPAVQVRTRSPHPDTATQQPDQNVGAGVMNVAATVA